MAKISLGTYTVRATEKYQRIQEDEERDYEEHGYVGGTYDTLDFVQEFLRTLHQPYQHLDRQESVFYVDDSTQNGRTVYGWLQAGKYGFAADLRDVNTEALSYHRTPEDVELIPHFFLLDLPPDTERGILILQRHGRRGVKTHFGHALKRAFSEWTGNGYMLDFSRHVPDRVIHELTQGQFRKAELITYEVPRDRNAYERGMLNEHERQETRGKVTLSLSAKEGERFILKPWMRQLLTRQRGFREIRESLELNPGDRIQLTVDYGGGERTIDLADPRAIRPYVTVPEEKVPHNSDGHPQRAPLVDFAMGLCDDLAEEIRGERRH